MCNVKGRNDVNLAQGRDFDHTTIPQLYILVMSSTLANIVFFIVKKQLRTSYRGTMNCAASKNKYTEDMRQKITKNSSVRLIKKRKGSKYLKQKEFG